LLLWARQPGDIDRLLHGRRSAAAAPQHGTRQQTRAVARCQRRDAAADRRVVVQAPPGASRSDGFDAALTLFPHLCSIFNAVIYTTRYEVIRTALARVVRQRGGKISTPTIKSNNNNNSKF